MKEKIRYHLLDVALKELSSSGRIFIRIIK